MWVSLDFHQHLRGQIGKILAQQLSRLEFKPQQLTMCCCSLYLIFISNGPKNNKWVFHKLGIWGLVRKRIGCYYGLVQVRSHTDSPLLPINDLFLSRLFAWILTHFSDFFFFFCLHFPFSLCIYISIYRKGQWLIHNTFLVYSIC